MTTNPDLERNREFSVLDSPNEFYNTSEDDESNSDTDYHISETESDDISTDEFISCNEDSSDSYVSDNDLSDPHVDKNISEHVQPEFIEKNGISWSNQKIQAPGRLPATHIFKKKLVLLLQLKQ